MEIQRTSNFVEKHLNRRRWTKLIKSTDGEPYFSIRIISYNILADQLMDETAFLYGNSFRQNLVWFRRRQRLFNEIFRQNADIVCLQEMQEEHFYNEFQPEFREFGYASIYVKRPRDRPDGCVIFYRFDRFELIRSQNVSFYQPEISLLKKENCGLMALFRPNIRQASSNDLFCIATTHLLYSPKLIDVKFAQLQYFLAEIDRFAMKNSDENRHFPIILCGDFNATPQSPLIEFLHHGSLNPNSALKQFLPSTFVTNQCRFPSENERNSGGILSHDKTFRSVYDLNDSRQISSSVNGDSRLVDFIFYTKRDEDDGRLTLIERFEMYHFADVCDVFLPNHQFPSDHFVLGGKFSFRFC